MGQSRGCGSYYGILAIKGILHCNNRKFFQIRRGLVKTSCNKLSEYSLSGTRIKD